MLTDEQIDAVLITFKDKDELRSYEKLLSFVEYCVAHPTHRFWQALRNWSGASSVHTETNGRFTDTFYIE